VKYTVDAKANCQCQCTSAGTSENDAHPEQGRNIEKARPNNIYVDFVVDAMDEPWQSERH
jgi:hypothetical protein